ncbi:flagellar hook-associated protein [Salinisphaera sp. T5B8]|uniref:flagellar filament capping protein FliD n=1 Tax=Salinisphaera sp. T5B8 TaxID=1304154 RepID=UPI00333F1DBD
MALTSSLGIGSGLDLSSLLDGLRTSEQQRLVPLQKQASSYNTKFSAYGTLQSSFANFQSAAEALGKASLYEGVKTSVEGDAFSAVASEKADPGSYSIEVDQLARSQSLVSAGQASVDEQIGNGGTITLSLGNSAGNVSETVDIELDAADSSLSGIRDAINAADIGVNASIVNDGSGTPYRLVLSSNTTGTDSQISVSVAENNDDGSTPLADLLDYDSAAGSGAMSETVAARDAQLSVNGIAVVSQTNRVEEAIAGVTLTLSKTTTEPQSLTATRDTDAVKSALQKFVKAYNSVNSISDKLTAFDAEKEISGVLLGDSTARTAETRVRGALNTPISGGTFSGLAEIGISLQRDGTMEIDDEALDEALANNLADVGQLMAGSDGNDGLSQVLVSTLDAVAGDNGLLQSASDGMKQRIDRLGDRMEREQESIDATIARYQKQFVQLDSLMASINSTSNYLTQQFKSLSNQGD